MATYQLTVTADGVFNRPGQLTKRLMKAFVADPENRKLVEGCLTLTDGTVEFSEEENISNYQSRAQEFDNAKGEFENIVDTIDGLIEGLESWRDNMPESLQGGSKSEEIDAAIEPLESLRDDLQSVTWPDVEFPGQ
jgi:hypothetical protein